MTDAERKELIRLLELDYEKTSKIVEGVVGTTSTIRGWGISLVSALIGFAFQTSHRELALLAIAATLLFALMDGYHSWLYARLLRQTQNAEYVLNLYYASLARGEDDPAAIREFEIAILAHRFGRFSEIQKFTWKSLLEVRPRIVLLGLYSALVVFSALTSFLIREPQKSAGTFECKAVDESGKSFLCVAPPSAAASSPQPTESLDTHYQLHATTPIQPDLHHVQGIDIEGNTLWISSVDAKARKGYLSIIELPSGRLVKQVEVQQGARIHPGGITLDGDSIWIPVAEYDRDGPTTIERRHKHTLALLSSFEVPDHIGCIAASPSALTGGSWSSRTIYHWTRDGRELWKRPNPIPTHWQDLKMDGDFLLGAGPASQTSGAIEWVSLPDLKLVRRLTTGLTDRGKAYTHEGMTLRMSRLFLLPEDAPSRLFEFRRK